MATFFSKKQKRDFRKRRQKLKQAGKLVDHSSDPSTTTDVSNESSNKRCHPDNGIGREHVSETEQTPTGNSSDDAVILVPKDLSSAQSKKFRKDARRRARAEGKDPSFLRFFVEGESRESSEAQKSDEKTQPLAPPPKKKRTVEFPRINDLIKQEREAKTKKEAEEARELADRKLPESYKSRYVALDCEMVGTGSEGQKSVLARVSIVDWDGNVVMDTFVQVPTRVTDFRTFVSGVTAKDIKSSQGAMKEKECRDRVAEILRGKVLVGHALKNDLHALLLQHPKSDIRDTAKFRPFQRLGGSKWRPRKLRDLVQEHLGLAIQQEGQAHDSIDDAKAAMQLFRRFRETWEKELEEKQSRRNKKSP